MRRTLLCLAVLGLAPAHSQDKSKGHPEACAASCATCAPSIKRALGYLEKHVMSLPDAEGTPYKQTTLAVAGLVYLLADEAGFGNHKDDIGRIKATLEKYVDHVADRIKKEEFPPDFGTFDSSKLIQYTWPVAIAGLFFAELKARGTSTDALSKVVSILEDAQVDGGWGHGRSKAMKASGYPSTLLATTDVVAPTLGILKNQLGMKVKGLDGVYEYYKRAQLSEGQYPYDPHQNAAGVEGTGRAGGALFALHCLGVRHDDPVFTKSLAFLRKHMEDMPEAHGSPALMLMYGALGMWTVKGADFERFRKTFFDTIIRNQRDDGSFKCICRGTGFAVSCEDKSLISLGDLDRTHHCYVTAMHTFVLLLRDNLKSLDPKKGSKPTETIETGEKKKR